MIIKVKDQTIVTGTFYNTNVKKEVSYVKQYKQRGQQQLRVPA